MKSYELKKKFLHKIFFLLKMSKIPTSAPHRIKNLTQSYDPEKHATCIKAAFVILIPFLSHIKKN